jgi:hypothetical protein
MYPKKNKAGAPKKIRVSISSESYSEKMLFSSSPALPYKDKDK